MSHKVELVRVSGVMNHPNAERLDIVSMQGKDWQCVVAKGSFDVADVGIYFPIDSILPADVESKIFGPNSKVKLTNSRVKTIKLRGAISQGLIVKPEVLTEIRFSAGTDLTEFFKVGHYEPQSRLNPGSVSAGKSTKNQTNPSFKKYTSIENAKNHANLFSETDLVCVHEKIHGTNFRCGYVPFHANTLWKKIKKFLRLAPKFEFVFGSHNVQLQSKWLYKGYYETNVYAEAVKKYGLQELLSDGEVVYGEIYGDGIQKGYTYGCAKGERRLVLFDVLKHGEWLDPSILKSWCCDIGLPLVPELYLGAFNKEKILALRDGPSVIAPSQKVREGVVVKAYYPRQSYIGRTMLKYISDAYLLKNQDDESEPH